MKYSRYLLALIVGFFVIFLGSVEAPGYLLPKLFGPFPKDGNVPFLRIFTDFWLSFVLAMLGGYLAALASPARPILIGLLSGMLYFCLSAYWYIGYDLVGAEWLTPILMLIKVPVAAVLGALLFKKFSNRS